jgi:hypothetical protein
MQVNIGYLNSEQKPEPPQDQIASSLRFSQ